MRSKQASERGKGELERRRENKPRPNLLPSDFTALRDGGRQGGGGAVLHSCDKELLPQGAEEVSPSPFLLILIFYIQQKIGDVKVKIQE